MLLQTLPPFYIIFTIYLPRTFQKQAYVEKKKKLICLSDINVVRNKGEVTLQDQIGISRKFQ